MMRHTRCLVLAIVAAVSVLPCHATAQRPSYPQTRRVDQVDSYFGTAVADPYRWLENESSPEVAAWVEAENKVTFSYFEKIPYRQAVRSRLETLQNYPRYGAPVRKGEWYIFSKNDGLQNQSVRYIQRGLDGTPEVLIDPNSFSADGTSPLASLSLSKNGKYAAFGISTGGSDWNEYHVMEVATRKVLPDVVKWARYSSVAWRGGGFFYGRYDTPDSAKALVTKNQGRKLYYHVVGTTQDKDPLVYEDKAHPDRFFSITTTEDERYSILSLNDNADGRKGNSLFFRDEDAHETTWRPIVPDIGDDRYSVIENIGGTFLIETNHGAPNGRVMLFDPAAPATSAWRVVVPERAQPLEAATTAGGKLFASYLKDVTTQVEVLSLKGEHENTLVLPGPGTATGFTGNADDTSIFFTFTSFSVPPSIYRYDIAARKATLYRAPTIPGFEPSRYVTREVFFKSKDGTRVPMFVTYRKGLRLDGTNPTLLYGYGGFNIGTFPAFSALRLALLEQGVVYASANMRGGNEYGEKWHEAGTKLHKQNVFDDFIGAAEYLIKSGYTRPSKLAIHGVSNGGLLVGAVANQRPELFNAVIQQAGVMDMLRFHKFTIGGNWTSDYGSADANEAEFKALRAYSPIHNVKPGTRYPATLITTADHDDRVVPAHSFKYAAALQAAQAGDAPILIRIDTKSGHGASSTTKALEQTSDLYSFLFMNLGLTPKY